MGDAERFGGRLADAENTIDRLLAAVDWSRRPRELFVEWVYDDQDSQNQESRAETLRVAERLGERVKAEGSPHGLRLVVPLIESTGIVLQLFYEANLSPVATSEN